MKPKPFKPYKPPFPHDRVPPKKPGEIRWLFGERESLRGPDFIVVHAIVVGAMWIGHFFMNGWRWLFGRRNSSSS